MATIGRRDGEETGGRSCVRYTDLGGRKRETHRGASTKRKLSVSMMVEGKLPGASCRGARVSLVRAALANIASCVASERNEKNSKGMPRYDDGLGARS